MLYSSALEQALSHGKYLRVNMLCPDEQRPQSKPTEACLHYTITPYET